MKVSILATAAFVASAAASRFHMNMKNLHPPKVAAKKTPQPQIFEQLIDHENPDAGTFKQRWWVNDQWYKGPGSPVVLFTPGEIAADGYEGYLTNETMTGAYAQAVGGAVIMIEHRYWGDSSPYDVLSTKNMQYLTLKNSIADLVYFSKNVELGFDKNGSSKSTNAPWVLAGGSYSGALAAWTEATSPDTFWAYHASSAPVEAIYDFWQYFAPIAEGMPKNCSRDVSKVINYMDGVFTNGTASQQKALKAKFGLESLEHNDDVMAVLENGPWSWQSNTFTTGYSEFYQFCDYVEGVAGNHTVHKRIPGAEGVGLHKALEGYASFVKALVLPGYCANFGYTKDPNDLSCMNTYNADFQGYTDTTVRNPVDRQWTWFLCNEPFAYWQDGAPSSTSSIVSRLVNADYWQRQCPLYFPADGEYTYGSAGGKKSVDDVNQWTGGWNDRNSTRLLWVNGQYDPWRSTSVSSKFRPGGPLKSTESAPVLMIPSGIHCSDLRLSNAKANPGVQAVVDKAIAQMKTWVGEYYEQKKGYNN